MNELIICEKNKAAEAVANAIGNPTKLKFNKIPYFYIKNKNMYVIPLRGHIKEYRNTDKYKSWSKSNPREILTDTNSIFKFPVKTAYNYIKLLEFMAQKKGITSCIIGTDADVEGCNIGLIDAFPIIKKFNNTINLTQLWLSSLQKLDILHAYNNQIQPKWNWAHAGEARAILDAVIGFSATKKITLTLKDLLKSLNMQFVSIGRVQTSLLYLIYLREQQIRKFVPKPFWVINAIITNNREKYICPHLKNPFQQEENSKLIYNQIKDEEKGFIKSKESKTISKFPPTPLNTSKALQLITRHTSVTAIFALKILEDLYLNQLITYPRTDTDKYKPTFDHPKNLSQFHTHSEYGPYSQFLIQKNQTTPNQGKIDAEDHPPITPILNVELNDKILPTQIHSKIYDLLSRYYFALFSKPAKVIKTKCLFSVKNEDFVLKNDVLIEEEPYEIAPFLMQKYNPSLILTEDQNYFTIDKIKLEAKETKPPYRYTDNTLIRLMESFKLGTKSTRPNMIQILIDRKYIMRKKRAIHLLELGYTLIDNLKDIWRDFLEPSFTAYVESQLELVKNGVIDWEIVINEIREKFLALFDIFLKNKVEFLKKFEDLGIKNQYRENLAQSTKSYKQETKVFCPICKKNPMTIIKTKKKTRFLACQSNECHNTYALPRKGKISILKNSHCQNCNFNIFRVKLFKDKKKIDYNLCPICWNHGLKEKIDGYGFCSKCENFEIKQGQCIIKK